jgi:hypothetical protein
MTLGGAPAPCLQPIFAEEVFRVLDAGSLRDAGRWHTPRVPTHSGIEAVEIIDDTGSSFT